MNQLENKSVYVLIEKVIGFAFAIIAFVWVTTENYSTFGVGIFALGSVVCLVLSIIHNIDVCEGISNKNEVTQMFNENPSFRFSMTSDFLSHVQTMFDKLKGMPGERLWLVNCLGLILVKNRLEALILCCINEKQNMLTADELAKLQEQLVVRFPEKTEKMFESISDFDRDNEETWSDFYRLILRYTKLTGKYGSPVDLAGGIFRYLETKGLAAGSIPIFAQKLDATLCEKGTFDRGKASEILREILRLNNVQ